MVVDAVLLPVSWNVSGWLIAYPALLPRARLSGWSSGVFGIAVGLRIGWGERDLAWCWPMAGQVIAVRVDGVEVLVETARVVGTEPTSIGDRAQQQVIDAFERAQEAIIAVSTKVAGTVRQLAARGARPDKVEVEFGLKFTAKGDVIVASGAGEVALKVIVGYDPRSGAADAGARRTDDDEADDEADGVS